MKSISQNDPTQDFETYSTNCSLDSFKDIDISESVNEIDLLILTGRDRNIEEEYRTEQAAINIAQDTTDDTMAPVTIYNSNQLGISISVEEPESQPNGSSANWEKQKSTVCNSRRKFPKLKNSAIPCCRDHRS